MEVLGKQIGLQDTPDKTILEIFPKPLGVESVKFETDEFTSLCPKTRQPDFANVVITYVPRDSCLESKSLKLYLQSYRMTGAFIEELSSMIVRDLNSVLNPLFITVKIKSVPRGGVSLEAISSLYNNTKMREIG